MVNMLLERIFRIALQLNEEGKYQAFLHLSPHVSSISVTLYEGAWEHGAIAGRTFDCYYDHVDSNDGLLQMGNAMSRYLLPKQGGK